MVSHKYHIFYDICVNQHEYHIIYDIHVEALNVYCKP